MSQAPPTAASYIVAFELGPVGEFIQAARRSRDLAFASWLLSDLARAAARAFLQAGGTLLAPSPQDVHDPEASVADQVVGLVEAASPDEAREQAREAGQAMADAARQRLVEVWDRVEQDLAKAGRALEGQVNIDKPLHLGEARAQVEDLLETAWVAVPVEGGDVGGARALALRLLAARLARHPFRQPSWAGPVPKSALGGERESVVDEAVYDAAARSERLAGTLFQRLGIGPAERIDGPGLLKRLGHRAVKQAGGGRQISTSHLGAHDTLTVLREWPPEAQEEAREAFSRHLERLEPLGLERSECLEEHPVLGRHDGHLLYLGRLVDLCVATSRGSRRERERATRQARRSLDTLFRDWRDIARRRKLTAPPRPHGYYAVLAADGDGLGRLAAGLASIDEHLRLARDLTAYAQDVRQLVAAHGGHAIYAGGDDVLALLPVSTCLKVAGRMACWIYRKVHERVTLSAGLVVAHHLDRYDLVLARAAAALDRAKAKGKNRWELEVRKRSGAPLQVGEPWDAIRLLTRPARAWRGELAREPLPRGLPGDLRAIALELPRSDEDLEAVARATGRSLDEVRAAFGRIENAELGRVVATKKLKEGAVQEMLQELHGHARAVAQGPALSKVADLLSAARAISGLGGEV